jgi:biopolymer transport protein ExbB/TolQ
VTTATVVWVCVGLVVAGIVLVVAAVVPLTRRVRVVRRTLRRLSWRREDLERLAARAEGLRDHLAVLQAQALEQAEALAARRAAASHSDAP